MIISPNLQNVKRVRKSDFDCTISVNAPLELFFALHAVANPSQHPDCESWARKRYESLSAELQKEIRFISDHYAQWIFATDVVENITGTMQPEECTVDAVAQMILKMDRNEFAYLFLGLAAFEYDKAMLDGWYTHPGQLKTEDLGVQQQFFLLEDVVFFLQHTEEIREKLVYVMKNYWEESFKEDWSFLEGYEKTMIVCEQEKLKELGLFDYIRGIHPDISVDENRIYFHKNPDFYINIPKIESICIHLSVFLSGSLGANVVGSRLFLAKSLSFQKAKAAVPVPKALLELFEICSDETRMKMIKVLWNGLATTQELAEILQVSASTVSQHMKLLKTVGIVDSYKANKFVYYWMKKDCFEHFSEWLTEYLEK